MISSYNAHTETFFKNLKLLKIQDIDMRTLKYIINLEIINFHKLLYTNNRGPLILNLFIVTLYTLFVRIELIHF